MATLLVAPLVGAWIEIHIVLAEWKYIGVAPLVGAWIEICNYQKKYIAEDCRSPRGSVD